METPLSWLLFLEFAKYGGKGDVTCSFSDPDKQVKPEKPVWKLSCHTCPLEEARTLPIIRLYSLL
jgi:hypothetical protein